MWDDLIFEFFVRRMAMESLLASSHVVDSIFWKCVAIDYQANLRWKAEEVEGLFSAVTEFEL